MMLRSFIAIRIPNWLQAEVARSTAALQKALPKPLIRWVAVHNVHLTLKFLGDVSPSNLELLVEALQVETVAHEAFDISVGGLGVFPNLGQARIIWIGIESPSALMGLLRGIEAVTAKLGYASEERPFSPHLTIGRVGSHVSEIDFQRMLAVLEGTRVNTLGTFRVESVEIFKSDLKPEGPVYSHLYTLPMKTNLERLARD
jgi:2'-5' RNA ligase